jgi:putative flippase GtrA
MKISKKKLRQILGFILAGLVGFLIEYTFIEFCVHNFGTGAIMPRFISFPTAVIITWYINRRLSFNKKSTANFSEFFRYFRSTAVAQATNVISYGMFILLVPSFSSLMALFIASFISTNVSFCLYSNYVFK